MRWRPLCSLLCGWKQLGYHWQTGGIWSSSNLNSTFPPTKLVHDGHFKELTSWGKRLQVQRLPFAKEQGHAHLPVSLAVMCKPFFCCWLISKSAPGKENVFSAVQLDFPQFLSHSYDNQAQRSKFNCIPRLSLRPKNIPWTKLSFFFFHCLFWRRALMLTDSVGQQWWMTPPSCVSSVYWFVIGS